MQIDIEVPPLKILFRLTLQLLFHRMPENNGKSLLKLFPVDGMVEILVVIEIRVVVLARDLVLEQGPRVPQMEEI